MNLFIYKACICRPTHFLGLMTSKTAMTDC